MRDPTVTTSLIMSGLQDTRVVIDQIASPATYPITVDLEQYLITTPEKSMLDQLVQSCRQFSKPKFDLDSKCVNCLQVGDDFGLDAKPLVI